MDAVSNIVMIATHHLIPDERNPRIHTEKRVQQVANSIQRFGFNNPILIHSDNRIIAGHRRHLAAQTLAMVEVPCVVLDHLDEEEALAYLVADNKLQEGTARAWELEVQNVVALSNAGFDPALLGYSQNESQKIFEYDPTAPEGPVGGTLHGADRFLLLIETETEEDLSALFAEMNKRGFIVKVMD